MASDEFERAIALAGECLEQAERAAGSPRGMTGDDAYVHHVRMQALYLEVCSIAAEHGNPSGQRMLAKMGAHLATLAKPHGEPD